LIRLPGNMDDCNISAAAESSHIWDGRHAILCKSLRCSPDASPMSSAT